jgi:hypothetical protein
VPTVDLSIAVKIDLLVWVVCALVLINRRNLRHSHPAVIYLAFHALVISVRALAVDGGAPTFLPGISGVEVGEVGRAVVIADIGLIAATLGWVTSGGSKTNVQIAKRARGHPLQPRTREPGVNYRPLQLKYFHIVAAVAMPLGLLAFSSYAGVSAPDATSVNPSSYFTTAATWPGLVLLALIYFHGFRPALVLPMVAYLGIMSIQGYDRFRLIIPVLLLCQIYLDRHGKRWPGKVMLALLAMSLVIFFPLKAIGLGVRQGESFSQIRAEAGSSIQSAFAGENRDQVVLDELAITISGSQASGRVLWGKPYLNTIVLPIPRQVWPSKPGLADYLKVISQPGRPLAQIGGVTTLVGDLYLNFRIPGLVIVMFLLARLSSRLFGSAYRRPYLSAGRFAYLLLAANFIQIMRDGLISLPVFLLVNMMPLIVILVLHLRVQRVYFEQKPLTARAASRLGQRALGAPAGTLLSSSGASRVPVRSAESQHPRPPQGV